MRKIFIKYGWLLAKLYAVMAVMFFTLLIMSVTIPGVGVLTLTTVYSVLDGIEKAEDICVKRGGK